MATIVTFWFTLLLLILTCILTCKAADATLKRKAHIPALRRRPIKLEWSAFDDSYDFIAMIYYNYESVCPAVLISHRTAITAANPLYQVGLGKSEKVEFKWLYLLTYDYTTTYGPEVVIRYLHRGYNQSTASNVHHISFQYHHYKTARATFDKSKAHAPMHDLATVFFEDPLIYEGDRYAFPASLGKSYGTRVIGDIRNDGMLTVAGFGYIDALHVKQDFQLEITEFMVKEVLVDCDYYVPRNWGHFICLLNIDRYVGVEAGSPLVHDGKVIGIGAFALARGADEVLIYTDLRKYFNLYYGSSTSDKTSFSYGYEVSRITWQ